MSARGPSSPTHEATRTRTYSLFIGLGSKVANASLAPLQKSFTPGQDTKWSILRVWCYSLGYESQVTAIGPASDTDYDPYVAQRGFYNGSTDTIPQPFNPMAMMYRQSIALDQLVQPWVFVPRTFEPIALQQPIEILENENLICFASEIIPANGDSGDRKNRGLAFGIEVIETLGVSP